ncbi:hypothetical protein QAD02_018678 [Eretmocerus hayati]|uniref:Uncharacterized protein n=1 Tax=Eretmocerus hayati TaxID=131215 RepID=A0ACC2PJ71_9HYME|nr:hypothetical protein QAD02_018678 [Eretmocerus hayati]
MSSLLNIDLFDAYPYPQLSLRVFLITLFKVGSIAQFRTNLQAIIAGKGQYETLCTDGKLESYKYFYSLFGNATPDEYNEITEVSAIILINLAKNSTIFGTNYDFDEVDLLTKNDDAMFVGAVLVKTWKTCLLNNTLSFVANPNCKTPNFLGQCLNGSCCGRSGFITPKASSIIYSCCPNVARSSTSNNTMVVYAIKPIEKGEKLYHGIYSIYNYAPKTERQKLFRKRYGFDCDCQACKYNWTERSFTDDIPREFSFEVNTALCDVMHFTQNFSKEDTSGDEIAVKFQECVEILWRYLQLPSMHLISTVKALMTIIQHLHYGSTARLCSAFYCCEALNVIDNMNEEIQKIKREFKQLLKDKDPKAQCALHCDTEPLLKSRDESMLPDLKLEGYKHFYSLRGNAFPDEDAKLIRHAALSLVGLAKYSSIFGSKFNSKNIDRLMRDDDAVYIGALFLKTSRIMVLNLHMTFLQSEDCKTPRHYQQIYKASICTSECCGKDALVALKASSITISCCPNVDRCWTYNNSSLVYALKPIKKGEQLTYGIKSIYCSYAPISERQKVFRKRYGFDCDCEACVANWTEKDFKDVLPKHFPPKMTRVMTEFLELRERMGSKPDEDIQLLAKTKEILEEFWKYLSLPSSLLIHGVLHLIKLYITVYGTRPAEVPEKCDS